MGGKHRVTCVRVSGTLTDVRATPLISFKRLHCCAALFGDEFPLFAGGKGLTDPYHVRSKSRLVHASGNLGKAGCGAKRAALGQGFRLQTQLGAKLQRSCWAGTMSDSEKRAVCKDAASRASRRLRAPFTQRHRTW